DDSKLRDLEHFEMRVGALGDLAEEAAEKRKSEIRRNAYPLGNAVLDELLDRAIGNDHDHRLERIAALKLSNRIGERFDEIFEAVGIVESEHGSAAPRCGRAWLPHFLNAFFRYSLAAARDSSSSIADMRTSPSA